VTARDGDRTLRVHVHDEAADVRAPASVAGAPVGPCPDCAPEEADDDARDDPGRGGTLVRADGAVVCVDCGARYGLPAGAELLAEPCDCGLPRMAVERGRAFELCVDRACESLDAAVAAAFDGAWDCPDCGAALVIRRARSLIAGCERYPDCETAFRVPDGVLAGTCECGLPAFAAGDAAGSAGSARCLDATCERPVASPTGDPDASAPPSG
jgi:DNA topoisomerase-1